MQCKRKCIRNGAVHQKAKQARAKLLDAFMIFYFIFYLVCTFIIFFHSFMCNFNLALREKRTKEWKTAQLFRSISVTKKKTANMHYNWRKERKNQFGNYGTRKDVLHWLCLFPLNLIDDRIFSLRRRLMYSLRSSNGHLIKAMRWKITLITCCWWWCYFFCCNIFWCLISVSCLFT